MLVEHRLRKNKTSVFVMKQVHHNSLLTHSIVDYIHASYTRTQKE